MAKYCGMIGFAKSVQTAPGVDTLVVEEHKYYGDIIDDNRKWEKSEQLNDDLNVTNKISIIADAFATENLSAMRYAKFMGAAWKIRSVSIAYPRIILTLGGLYNGQTC